MWARHIRTRDTYFQSISKVEQNDSILLAIRRIPSVFWRLQNRVLDHVIKRQNFICFQKEFCARSILFFSPSSSSFYLARLKGG